RVRKVRLGVEPPPLLAELGQRLLAGVELRELSRAPAPQQVGIEGLGVVLASKNLRPVAPTLAPAHAPYDAAVLSHHALDAPGGGPSSSARRRRKLPRAGGTGLTTTACGLTRTVQRATQSSKPSRGIRSREQSRTARSSPRWIAR